ncbi:MAG: sensor domain-containing diguanylate cyclase [Oscillospiraceae bacterium]|nr:sensor domain-containing diguanylate cyclase [Oscillospiraceae bacterium]
MQNIQKIIVSFLFKITLFLMVMILGIYLIAQIFNEQKKAKEDTAAIFSQINQILAENKAELTEIVHEYSETCLHNAESIAYMLQNNPEMFESADQLREIAYMLEVDEIHIFDTTGRIFAGTHPQYYGYTFDSGEQIGYFKPMLKDKSLKLVQQIAPNTAEEKLMQYSALWSEDGKFIVQVGMEPTKVMNITEKNELSYIFGLLRANTGVNLYAINTYTGEIEGATAREDVGKNLTDIGLDMNRIIQKKNVLHANVKGVDSFCIFMWSGDTLIGRVVSNDTLYSSIPQSAAILGLCLAIIAFILVLGVSLYMNRYVVRSVHQVNDKLRLISTGDLDKNVDVRTSTEFSELSDHINTMVESLLASTEKISRILNQTDLPIGVYEYSKNMHSVRFTDYVPKILHFDAKTVLQYNHNSAAFKEFMDALRTQKIPEEKNVYALQGDAEHYVKLDEIIHGNDVLGIVMDVTEDILARRKIEAERDVDLLTGLYNRRGLDGRLLDLYRHPEKLGKGAMIMIDADGLKQVNDQYGHKNGDIYLQKIAGVINNFGIKSSIAARQGGDEFVLFLYHYDAEEEIMATIKTLEYIQDHSTAHLNDDIVVPLSFSFGYALLSESSDYSVLLKNADERMYTNKKSRKKQRST